MLLDEIRNAKEIVVGMRQTVKAVEGNRALAVYFAKDAEEKVTSPVLQSCKKKGIQVYFADNMAELGKACRIKVGAAMCAIIEK
ncbi:MAG: 50S ribosomal protein L7Ae-like protein [Firmicutes bacterium]|nr:50S ribosomal protein L7Ae-like protein [Bacillota bacterium]